MAAAKQTPQPALLLPLTSLPLLDCRHPPSTLSGGFKASQLTACVQPSTRPPKLRLFLPPIQHKRDTAAHCTLPLKTGAQGHSRRPSLAVKALTPRWEHCPVQRCQWRRRRPLALVCLALGQTQSPNRCLGSAPSRLPLKQQGTVQGPPAGSSRPALCPRWSLVAEVSSEKRQA